jgi:2-desacetyl-2-hydroxyethyl bacteriochlorophyllide A dehydrogenase
MENKRKAKAIIFPEPGKTMIGEVPLPPMEAEDVLIEVAFSTVSAGTERWCLTGKLVIPGEPPMAYPHVPGYQAAGIVREAGSAVTGLKAGDKVFSRNCKTPREWKGSWWGGHIGWHVAHQSAVIKIPDSVSTRAASSLLLAQVGYNGASKPPVSPGDVAVVIGEGLVGQYAAQVLRHRGAHVILSGLFADRLALALEHSADEVFDASHGDFDAFLRERFPKGVAIALDTASSAETVRLAADVLRYGGHLVMNGYYPPPESLVDWHWLRTKELTLHCPNSRTRERLERTLGLIAEGAIKVEELVTDEFPLDGAPKAYAMLLDPRARFLGMIIRWGEEA